MAVPDKQVEPPEEAVPPPTGTLFVMTVYLAVLAAVWGALFWGLLTR